MEIEYKNWLAKAEQDFETAKYNLKGNKLDAAAFFFQQSAEKALKADHIKSFGNFPKIHDLVSLTHNLNFPEKLLEGVRLLTSAYQYTRYPDIPNQDELAEEIFELERSSSEVLQWAKKNL